ncbi:MAG: type VI secretion system contractile sheath large subunit [Pseudomonadota bacterium]
MVAPRRPFYILALAPVHPTPETEFNPRLVPVDLSSLDAAMSMLGPSFVVPTPRELCPDGGLKLEIRHLKDFKPDILIRETPFLKAAAEAGKFVEDSLSFGARPSDIMARLREQWPELPPALLTPPEDAGATPAAVNAGAVEDILSLVAIPDEAPSSGKAVRNWPGRFQTLLGSLLKIIFENKEFRVYEAAWRGLDALVRQGPIRSGADVRLEVAAVSPANLEEALEKLTGRLGLDLPGLVLIDLPFDNTPRSIGLLEKIAEFAATLLAPTAVWLDQGFLHLDDWAQLGRVQYLKNHLEDAAYAKWRKLKDLDGAPWMSVLCNRFSGRAPYGPLTKPQKVEFDEHEPLWLSPVWALGAAAAQSLNLFGWPSRFTEYTKVALTDLTLLDPTGKGPLAAEIHLSEDRIMEFIEAGVTPLVGVQRKDRAFFPKETALAGNSFRFQLFMSQLLGFFFHAKDNLDQEMRTGDLAENLTAALAGYWEKRGGRPPRDLTIQAGPPDESGGIPLRISLTPPGDALSGGGKLDFTFTW